MVGLRRQMAVLDSVRQDEAPHRCNVTRCQHAAEQGAEGAPAPFCANHWQYLKPWQRRALTEAFQEKRWEDYFEIVRLCANDLETDEERARDMGFQGLVLARHFSAAHPRGVVVRMAGRAI